MHHLIQLSQPAAGCRHPEEAATSPQGVRHDSSRQNVQVFSRTRAIQLEAELQVLPAGQLLAAQQQHSTAWAHQQQQQWKEQLQADPGFVRVCRQQQEHEQGQQQKPEQQQQELVNQHQQQQLTGTSLAVLSQQVLPWQQQISRLMQQLTNQVCDKVASLDHAAAMAVCAHTSVVMCLLYGAVCHDVQPAV